jgi:orotidine-5'-phosphate decarboxylase
MAEEMKGRKLGGDGKVAEIDGGYFGGYVKPANHRENRRDRRLARNQNGKRWFDIEETIKNAVAQAAKIGISFLSLHGVNGVLRAAVQGRGTSNLKILCVTLLTSMDAEDIQEMGYSPTVTVEDLVVRRAVKAMEIGVDGVIASALEASKIKSLSRGKLMVVSPAIRPLGSPDDDQKRIATPSAAIKAGADYLVVGRPITGADNPKEAAHKIIVEMADAMGELSEGRDRPLSVPAGP